MLKLLGIEEERLRKEWISASEGSRFAETVRTFTEDVKRLGRNPLVKRETAA
jgi:F420-non-reducing hydrogenase iron-sulfur subunit